MMTSVKFLKRLAIFGVEILLLYFLIRFVATKEAIIPELNEVGEIGQWNEILFLAIFFTGAILLAILDLLEMILRKHIFASKRNSAFIVTLLFGAIIISFPLYSVLHIMPYIDYLWTLLLLPLPIFILRYLVAKLLSKKTHTA